MYYPVVYLIFIIKNTKQEHIVRKYLFAQGFRFLINVIITGKTGYSIEKI
jgi:hypothetical protein